MMLRALVLLALCACITSASAQDDLLWWQKSVVYQIYPRSFKDSNGDGIGDITGITSKLNHIVDIGVDCLWLSPIFKSPMKDFGYDISDFRDVDPIFGTLADLENLIAEAHARDIKILLDIVPNHSSDEHEWFIKSVAREDPYTDYYTWLDPNGFNASGDPIPPNNWLSVFGGSAWQWSETRQQFYLHQFVAGQPDLNYRNPLVVQEMNDILRFWLDKGVDGFRIDAVPHLMEDQTFPDEPLSGNPEATPEQWAYLNHIYTTDLPELYDVIRSLRQTVDEKQAEQGRELVMMVEAYTSIENTMKYYGNDTHPGAHFPFNFQFIIGVTNETRAQEMQDVINSWYDNMPAGRWANWVIGNHDQPRVATRFGRDFSIAAQMISQLLPGTSVTYNGEEINMENTWISWEDTVDPQGCQAGIEYYEKYSRDPTRTPYQWNDDLNAGFSTGPDTWLPVNENYVYLNIEAQKIANESPYKIYKKLTGARKLPAIQSGSLNTLVINPNVFAFTRELSGQASFLVVINLGNSEEVVDVTGLNVPETLTVFTTSLGYPYNDGSVLSASSITLIPRSGLVLEYPLA